MPDRKLSNDVDGFTVDEYAGTFTGSFDVRGADARYLAYDDEVLLVVRARVKPPRLKENKNGEITRVNVLAVKEAGVVRSDKLKQHLCDTLGLEAPAPQLPFDASEVPPAPSATNEPQDSGDLPEDVRISDQVLEVDPSNIETDVEEIFSPGDSPSDVRRAVERGPSPVERRLVGTTRDARLAAFLNEA